MLLKMTLKPSIVCFFILVFISHTATAQLRSSHNRGLYNSAFQLKLYAPNGEEIRYSINSDAELSINNSNTYTAPLRIENTSVVQAAYIQGDGKLSATQYFSYIFPAQVVNVRAGNKDLTVERARYGIYGNSIGNELQKMQTLPELSQLGNIKQKALNTFLRFPTVSIFSKKIGARDPEPSSIEIFTPNGVDDYNGRAPQIQANSGIQIFGGSSRYLFPKKSLRIYFKKEFGQGSLDFPLFKKDPQQAKAATSFDQILLRSYSHDSLFWFSSWRKSPDSIGSFINPGSPPFVYGTYARDKWAQLSFAQLGEIAPHSRPAHVYINGRYWGVYQLMERPTASFASSYLGGKKEDFFAYNAGCTNTADTDCEVTYQRGRQSYYGISSISGEHDLRHWRSLYSNRFNPYKFTKQVNTQNLANFVLLFQYGANSDLNTARNWYAIGHTNDGNEQLRFVPWDNDFHLRNSTFDLARFYSPNNNINGFGGPGYIFPDLLSTNADFVVQFMDQANKQLSADGVFSPENMKKNFNQAFEEVADAIPLDIARWWVNNEHAVTSWQPVMANFYKKPIAEVSSADRLRLVYDKVASLVSMHGFFDTRNTTLLSQFREDWKTIYDANNKKINGALSFPINTPPKIELDTSFPQTGSKLVIKSTSNLSHYTYYTLNDEDPRLPGGAINPRAILWRPDNTSHLEHHLNVKARALTKLGTTNVWSALAENRFRLNDQVEAASWQNLNIDTIHYHPRASEDFEFLSLKNTSPDKSIELQGIRFVAGIDFQLQESKILSPGEKIVIAANPQLLREKYQHFPTYNVDGTNWLWPKAWDKNLKNSGEQLILWDKDNNTIFSFEYDDKNGWPIEADGRGAQLKFNNDPANGFDNLADKNLALSSPSNWEAEAVSFEWSPLLNKHDLTPNPNIQLDEDRNVNLSFSIDRNVIDHLNIGLEETSNLRNWSPSRLPLNMVDFSKTHYQYGNTITPSNDTNYRLNIW